jgi:hypothetical protein
MATYRGSAETASASRYLQQLCKHWSHKFAVEFDPAHGRIEFDPETACELDAGPARLSVRLEAADPERAERIKQVIADHLKRFAFREDFVLAWDAAAPRTSGV